MLTYHVATPQEMEFHHKLEEANVIEWNSQIEHDMAAIYEQNHFFRENHRQWGRSRSNSGNGQLEARIPIKLHYMMMQKDPHYFKDDASWDHFLSLFPGLKVQNR